MPLQDSQKYSYAIKIVNPSKKSDFRVYNIRDIPKFVGVGELESLIKKRFEEFSDYEGTLCMGFVQPGHGWKGKQHWINDEADLEDMYSLSKKNNIMIWCHQKSQKRSRSSSKSTEEPATKRAKCIESNEAKITDAKKTYEILVKKHKIYTPEQLHAWAQLIQMKKHFSMDEPPKYPFFKKTSRKDVKPENSITEQQMSDESASLLQKDVKSPTKVAELRMKNLEQLKYINELYKDGVLTEEEFREQKTNILLDIRKL